MFFVRRNFIYTASFGSHRCANVYVYLQVILYSSGQTVWVLYTTIIHNDTGLRVLTMIFQLLSNSFSMYEISWFMACRKKRSEAKPLERMISSKFQTLKREHIHDRAKKIQFAHSWDGGIIDSCCGRCVLLCFTQIGNLYGQKFDAGAMWKGQWRNLNCSIRATMHAIAKALINDAYYAMWTFIVILHAKFTGQVSGHEI